MVDVLVDGVSMRYGDVWALRDLHLRAEDGEAVVLVGPTGSGKTTLLRVVAGIESATSGDVLFDGRPIDPASPDRDVTMMFADNRLYPTMTARGNISFPLTVRKTPEPELSQRVETEAAVLGISRLLERKPGEMSAGQRGLVQLAKAMVRAPGLFLIDEPLAAIDAVTRRALRSELRRIQSGYGVTAIYATHDQEDAMALGDRMAVMHDGRIRQIGSPDRVYARPEDTFVATFIGTPDMALLTGKAGSGVVVVGDLRLRAPRGTTGEVLVGVRPERWHPSATGIRGTVNSIEDLGSVVYARVGTVAGTFTMRVTAAAPEIGSEVVVTPTAYHLFDGDTGRAIAHHETPGQR